GRGAAMQGHVLASATAVSKLQPLQPVQAPDALEIDRPTLSSEEDVQPLEAEARPRVRQLAQTPPEDALVLRTTRPIPRRSREAGQATGAHARDTEGLQHPADALPALDRLHRFFRMV